MASAQVCILVFIAVLHAVVQADNGQVDTTKVGLNMRGDEKQDLGNSIPSDEHAETASDETNLSELIENFIKEWNTYYNVPKSHRAPRTKRWAEMEKRPGYYNTYSPSRSYSRYRYPSNLMALLRGTKRGWAEQPMSAGRWQYPSNLMVLLRGKKSATEKVDDEDDNEEEPSDLEKQAAEEVMKRIAEGWRTFLESYVPKMTAKRSAFYGYDDHSGSSISRRPFGARQFMVWNGGRYILG